MSDSVDRVVRQLESAGAPNITAITLNDFDIRHTKGIGRTRKLRALTGRYFEDISIATLQGNFGKADLLIDLFGVFAYTLNLGFVTSHVAEVMKPGGELWFKRDYCEVLVGKRRVPLSQFLQSTGLFEIVTAEPKSAVLLRRTEVPAYQVQAELVDFDPRSSGLPYRLFRSINR